MRAKLDATLAEEEKIEAHALQVAEDRTAKEKKRRDRLKKLRLDEERYVSARGCVAVVVTAVGLVKVNIRVL